MGIVQFAILIVVILAIVGIVWWAVREMGVPIPQPVRIVLIAVVAIVAILLLASLAGVGPVVIRW